MFIPTTPHARRAQQIQTDGPVEGDGGQLSLYYGP